MRGGSLYHPGTGEATVAFLASLGSYWKGHAKGQGMDLARYATTPVVLAACPFWEKGVIDMYDIYRVLEVLAKVAQAGWAPTARLTLILMAVAAAALALHVIGLQMFM